jgi:hypothetical protein
MLNGFLAVATRGASAGAAFGWRFLATGCAAAGFGGGTLSSAL